VIVFQGKLDVIEAAKKAHRLGINPGGEVVAIPVEEGHNVPTDIFEAMWNNVDRLIPVEEARVLFQAMSRKEYEALN